MSKFVLFIVATIFLCSCKNKKPADPGINATSASPAKTQNIKNKPPIHTDTLQFIHFEGNFDYWSCVFLDSSKDTITLVTDSIIDDRFKNQLFEVKWFTDTLYQAGDNDSKYAANRMTHFRPINGKPFVAAISEKQILQDIRNLPEVQAGADQVGIAEKPHDGKNYYLVETGTRGEDNFSRFLMFRVYTYPKYEIRVYNPAEDTDVSLEQWRKREQ